MKTHKRDEALRPNESFALYTPKGLARRLGISRALLARWRLRGGGPKFIAESRNCVVYLVSDVNAWLHERRRDRLSYPKMKAAAKKRVAAQRKKATAADNVTPIKRRRSTRADRPAPTESPGA